MVTIDAGEKSIKVNYSQQFYFPDRIKFMYIFEKWWVFKMFLYTLTDKYIYYNTGFRSHLFSDILALEKGV
ncbi:hypothetical protein KUTeg_002276 [Tegillarca granosa]|uniref:Uncharacterized protein n=1 Tax=Tegillarca granosa TaxID=220873 RepID=A0ABQ9FTV1_TEGGR|nr:hypothetical protein KUTeg_002276 [Tegillarca granosa]